MSKAKYTESYTQETLFTSGWYLPPSKGIKVAADTAQAIWIYTPVT